MKQFFLAVLFIWLGQHVFAQAEQVAVDAFQVRANAYPLGLDVEMADSNRKTINVSLGLMGSFAAVGNTAGDRSLTFGVAPYADLQYRWFYKLKREAKRGHALRGNSGNFLAVRAEAKTSPVLDVFGQATNQFSFGFVWGLQRQHVNGFHIGFECGFGYAVDAKLDGGFIPMGNIKVGWVLFDQE